MEKQQTNATRLNYNSYLFSTNAVNDEWIEPAAQLQVAKTKVKSRHIYTHYLMKSNCAIYLSKRQAECLLLLRFYTQKGIAEVLNLSPRTVESYFANLREKLNCKNKFELIEISEKMRQL